MKKFLNDKILLTCKGAEKIYEQIRDLPVIDYHCHLSPSVIANDDGYENIGKLWLECDHYKWRAMRACGVDEHFITGNASWEEKFIAYASVMPSCPGSPLYYWSHMELKTIFGIDLPLCKENAKTIYEKANAILKNIKTSDLFAKFNVVYVATTDDPTDDLAFHKQINSPCVRPTFRPDAQLGFSDIEIEKLEKVSGVSIVDTQSFMDALTNRLDYFISLDCRISDHGFKNFTDRVIDKAEAEKLFAKRSSLSTCEVDLLRVYFLKELAKEYKKRGILMQIHFDVLRNVNTGAFEKCGRDSGYDVMSSASAVENVITFLNSLADEERPKTVLYTLNPTAIAPLTCACGAFRNVKVGPAWWFNDTALGIRRNLEIIAEYGVLGTNYGMLTDSRSFSSYVRFDFFRRILASYLGELVEKGEYDLASAIQTAKNISYYNIKKELSL